MVSVHLDAGKVEVRQIPQPIRPDGFALIRLLVGGICNTDLELQRGYYGFSGVPGLRICGRGGGRGCWRTAIGKRVVGENQSRVRPLLLVPAAGWAATVRALFGVRHRAPSRRFLRIPNFA